MQVHACIDFKDCLLTNTHSAVYSTYKFLKYIVQANCEYF